VDAPPTGGGDGTLPGVPAPSVLGAGGAPAFLGELPVTGASFDRLAIALLVLVGISSIWATGRREEGVHSCSS
jgi:hypothetical protein